MSVRLKRAYEPPTGRDGHRVLVDWLWPRGLSKESAELDEWLKEIAPSAALRKWFGHAPERFAEFRSRYREELRSPSARAQLAALRTRAKKKTVTLVYSAQDEAHNNAVVLAAELARKPAKRRKAQSQSQARRSWRGPS